MRNCKKESILLQCKIQEWCSKRIDTVFNSNFSRLTGRSWKNTLNIILTLPDVKILYKWSRFTVK